MAGAIHSAAGPGLAEECRALAPISPGQAVISSAHNLPNQHVIHCLGPVYGVDEPSDRLLADCFRNALRLADELEEGVVACVLADGGWKYLSAGFWDADDVEPEMGRSVWW